MRGVEYSDLNELFATETVGEWNGGLWKVSSIDKGFAFLDFLEGSFPFYLMQNRPGVEDSGNYGHLVGEAPIGALANIRSWLYRYDLETGQPVGQDRVPGGTELANEFASTHPQS